MLLLSCWVGICKWVRRPTPSFTFPRTFMPLEYEKIGVLFPSVCLSAVCPDYYYTDNFRTTGPIPPSFCHLFIASLITFSRCFFMIFFLASGPFCCFCHFFTPLFQSFFILFFFVASFSHTDTIWWRDHKIFLRT